MTMIAEVVCSCGAPKDRRAKACAQCYHRRWTEAEEAVLLKLLTSGATYNAIAKQLNRSETSVVQRARLRDWRHDPEVTTANRAAGRTAFWADKARVREWKRKVVKALRTPEARAIYAAELRQRNLAGKMGVRHHTEATKERIRAAHLGRSMSAETKAKISKARKRYWIKWRIRQGRVAKATPPRLRSGPRVLPAFYGLEVSMTLPQSARDECTVGGYLVRLSPRLARILEILLIRGPQQLTNYDEMLEMIWPNPDDEPEDGIGVLKVQVSMLRKRGIAIDTEWGRGIRIAPPADCLAMAA